MVRNLSVDTRENPFSEIARSNQQLSVFRLFGITRQKVKQINGIRCYLRITGKKAKIRVDLRRNGVIIPRSHVYIATDTTLFPPHHHANFGVCF